jgi:hypothetical protein
VDQALSAWGDASTAYLARAFVPSLPSSENSLAAQRAACWEGAEVRMLWLAPLY